MHKFGKNGKISLYSLASEAAKKLRKLKKIYSFYLQNGTENAAEAYFADNFHSVLRGCFKKPSRDLRRRFISLSGLEMAGDIIERSGEEFPGSDGIIKIIRDRASLEKIYAPDVEYLAETLRYNLICGIFEMITRSDPGVIRLMSLLSDIGSVDLGRINEVVNPVAIRLSRDPAYRRSDIKTKSSYREAIYLHARKNHVDECDLCDELLEKSRGGFLDLRALGIMKNKYLQPKHAVFAVIFLMIFSALLSVLISGYAGCPWLFIMLILPAVEALRPLSDRILRHNISCERLMRLEQDDPELEKERVAIVLSAQITDPEGAEEIYDKLLRLHCLNPGENIMICALLDLAAEQVPITSEDRAIFESLREGVMKLENKVPGKFSVIVRKRNFSETQQEYMGKCRKRGALAELCEFLKTGSEDFYLKLGRVNDLIGCDYICAVDSDTLPLMDSVRELLATALHPMNKIKTEGGKITHGYGIIAPRMITRLEDSLRTEFSKSVGGIGSRSSYDGEAANLWQDVFGRGTFCGKGLINVTALHECSKMLTGERILSHDILEGEILRTAYASDILFTEGFPKSPQSYYRRLDRWIRGDFQNIPEIFSKRFDCISKLKLLDNLRRAMTPVSVFSCFFPGFFLDPPSGGIIAFSAVLMWISPSLWGALRALFYDGGFGRSYYSGLLSTASQSLRYILYSVIMLPTLAVKSLRAAVTAVLRLMSGRNLLEWTTADAQDKSGALPLRYYLAPEVLSLSLLWQNDYLIRLAGAVFSMMPALLCIDLLPAKKETAGLRYRDSRELSKQTADMWSFFENSVTAGDNYLPPDNVQFSPVYRVAHRTSPTNIGLYMLSCLAAYDRKLINRRQLHDRLLRTLETVERLEKYKGNLYNWYDTETLKIIEPEFVSSVDSGNFTVCMVALKEGLYDLGGEMKEIAGRIEKIINATDLAAFYDGIRGLMAIGIEKSGNLTKNRYDFLMSEARLLSYWAIASRQVPKSHWQRLSRAMLSSGFFGGAASYSGTMFEFFMPEIFLKSPEGSLSSESLKYALWVQRKYASKMSRPYGISESGCYSFDPALNYRYSAHGVPATGIRRGLEKSYVISPYSTYISYSYAPREAAENLRELCDLNMYGAYGLYEALDYTSPSSGSPEPVRSYMAHHVGMSILSADNVLSGGIMQKRFMKDLRSMGAAELLDERFHLGTAVFENILRRPPENTEEKSDFDSEIIDRPDPFDQKMRIFSNGESTLLMSCCGCSKFIYRSKNVYDFKPEPFTRLGGFICLAGEDGDIRPFAVNLENGGVSAELCEDSVKLYMNTQNLRMGLMTSLHESLPCEIRRFAFKNETGRAVPVNAAIYIEPSLLGDQDERAHPAYSKMFLRLDKDPALDVVTVTRVREDKIIYAAFGFVEDLKLTVSFDRGEVLKYPFGADGLKDRVNDIRPSLICEPDPCVYIGCRIDLPAKSSTELTAFTVCAQSKEELINRINILRRKRASACRLPRADTAAGRVAGMLLPKILYGGSGAKTISPALLPLNSLFEISAATDIPTVALELNGRNDRAKLSAYLGAYHLIRRCGLKMQLIAIYDDGGRYEREHYNDLVRAAEEAGCEGFIYSPGGILPLDISKTRPGLDELARAFSRQVCESDITESPVKKSERKFIKIERSEPGHFDIDKEVACGGFSGCDYVIDKTPPLPWCHVLSNPVFGTLLSSCSLGFSYAFNSRECRLTPWSNDPMRDNSGERLLLLSGGKFYDLIDGSAAKFGFGFAEYSSQGENYLAKIRVTVSAKGMCKKISVDIKAPAGSSVIYYTEPCLSPDRFGSGMLIPKMLENGLLIHAPSSETGAFMGVMCSEKAVCETDREKIFSGDFSGEVSPREGLAAAVKREISGDEKIDFFLTCALSENAAINMPKYFTEQEFNDLPDKNIPENRRILAKWLYYQALHGRFYAKTGFYQCSGAFGFRDQLQDACCIAKHKPDVLKSQILRCCMAQFAEGDVMHWVHSLPNKKRRGVRTHISDDPLWLAYAVCEYIKATGDEDILDISVAYSGGLDIPEEFKQNYGEVYRTAMRENVYHHCKRAIDHLIGKTGKHGLMLIGSGDWNDGFDKVGMGGGESVWLSEFYIMVLERFSLISMSRGEREYAENLRKYAEQLRESVSKNCRDKDHWLRGFYGDGEPLGSQKSECCRIDSIAQSFAIFAGLDRDFTREALLKAYRELYDKKRGTVRLFAPAFNDMSEPDPGYIKNYPEGLRENGGQYTHAAVWLAIAMKRAGLDEEAEEIIDALSPVAHSENGGHQRYKTEPYYLCGDVYTNKNCMGRGGWSIYTGAAGWLLRGIEGAGV